MIRWQRWWPMKPLTPRTRILRMGGCTREGAGAAKCDSTRATRLGQTRIRSSEEGHRSNPQDTCKRIGADNLAFDLQRENKQRAACAMRDDATAFRGERRLLRRRRPRLEHARAQDARGPAAKRRAGTWIRRRDSAHEVVNIQRALRPVD